MNRFLYEKGLTTKEAAVVLFLMQGLSNKAIGASMGVSDKTIKFHLTNVYRKLGLKSRASLIATLLPMNVGTITNETHTQ